MAIEIVVPRAAMVIPTGGRHFKLSPSDLVFLWEECRRCFYLKVVSGIQRPRQPMPKIFMKLDSYMKGRFHGRHTSTILPDMPSGVLDYGERWVESRPIFIPGRSVTCFIRGRFDLALTLDAMGYGVVDLKTAERKSEHIPLYSRQLHSYSYALENPAAGKLHLKPVTDLGLLVFEGDAFSDNNGIAAYAGPLTWIPVVRDDGAFMAFLDSVLAVLEAPAAPANVSCDWCRFGSSGRVA